MGNITFAYHGETFNFPRTYCAGFVAGNYLSNFRLSGAHLLFDYAPANLNLDFLLRPNFYGPNSNVYSINFAFDESNCWCYQLGVPFPVTTNIAWLYLRGEHRLRIHVASDVPPDPLQLADLPDLPGYWLSF